MNSPLPASTVKSTASSKTTLEQKKEQAMIEIRQKIKSQKREKEAQTKAGGETGADNLYLISV